MVAASLLASPVTWHNYLLILAPGVLLLFAEGRTALASLLVAVSLIPQQWVGLWEEQHTVLASIALALYSYILITYWLAFWTTGVRHDLRLNRGSKTLQSSEWRTNLKIGVKTNED